MRTARTLVFLLAITVFTLMVLSGPGVKQGWWAWDTGLTILRWATYIGMGVAAAALILVVLLAVPRWRVRPWVPLAALILALLTIAPPMIIRNQASGIPPIHDITTDALDPPMFVSLMTIRQQAPNGVAYGGPAIAAQQQKAYSDIKPVVLKIPPNEALQKSIDAARSLGWDIVASDATAGRIEATATTYWFGFKDDVVIRVRPETGGSRVDVRSVSRVGRSDLGANAKRVREFIAKLS